MQRPVDYRPSKEEQRQAVAQAIAEFHQNGGQVTRCPTRKGK